MLFTMVLLLTVGLNHLANPASSLFGSAYPSDVTGDGPKSSTDNRVSSRSLQDSLIEARSQVRRLKRKLKEHRGSKDGETDSVVVNAVATEDIPSMRLDGPAGRPENFALDSQAGISGRRVNPASYQRIYPNGLTRATEPLRITGVVGGEVLLHHYGTAIYNFTDAYDNKSTFRYPMLTTWAVESSQAAWDTSIISLQNLLMIHPRNHFVRIEATDDAPYANDMGIVLYRPNNTCNTTRIHVLDNRWWLSGREKPQASVNNLTGSGGTCTSSREQKRTMKRLNKKRSNQNCVTVLCMSGRKSDEYMSVVRIEGGNFTSMQATVNALQHPRSSNIGPSPKLQLKKAPAKHRVVAKVNDKRGTASGANDKSRRGHSILATAAGGKPRSSKHKPKVTKSVRFSKSNATVNALQRKVVNIKTGSNTEFTLLDAEISGTSYRVNAKLWKSLQHFAHAKRIITIFPSSCQPVSQPVSELTCRMRKHFPELDPIDDLERRRGRQPGSADLIKTPSASMKRWSVVLNAYRQFELPKTKPGKEDVLKLFNTAFEEAFQSIISKFSKHRIQHANGSIAGTVIAISIDSRDVGIEHSEQLENLIDTFSKRLHQHGATIARYVSKHETLATPTATDQKLDSDKEEDDSEPSDASGKRRKKNNSSTGLAANSSETPGKRKPAKEVKRKKCQTVPSDPSMDLRLTPRAGRQPPILQPSRVQMPYAMALRMCGGAAPERIAKSLQHWVNVDLIGAPKDAKFLPETEMIEMMKRKLGRRSNQSIRRPLRYGFTASMDWIIFSHPSLGGHMNALIVVEHWSSCTKTCTSLKRDMATAYVLLEDALDWFDAVGSGPAQRLIIYLSSDDDKAFNNKAIRALCATRRIILETEPARQSYKNSKHETVIQDVKIGSAYVNAQGGGSDWAHGSSLVYFETVRNHYLTVGDRPAPPLAMLTNRRYDMQHMFPFLYEIYGADICLSNDKSDPGRVKLYIINSFQSGVIAIDELEMKEHRLSRRQFFVSKFQYSSDDPLSRPIAFESFRLNVMTAPPTNQGIVSPFSAMRKGLVRPMFLSKAALTIYLRKLQRGVITPTMTENVRQLGDLAKPTEITPATKLERPGDAKAIRLGRAGRTKAKDKRNENKTWLQANRKKLRKSRKGAQRRPAPTEIGTFLAPDDAARYAGAHDDICMSCNKGGGTLICCDTCPRTCHSEIPDCTELQPIHPASTTGAINKDWYCSSCCMQFENGTYVSLEDYEALNGRSVLSEGSDKHVGATFDKDFGEPHGIHYGTVVSYDAEARLYQITYADGDSEDLTYDQLIECKPTLNGTKLVKEQAGRTRRAKRKLPPDVATPSPEGASANVNNTTSKRPNKVSFPSKADESARRAQHQMESKLQEADREHRSSVQTSVQLKIPRKLERISARVNQLGPTTRAAREAATKYRLAQRQRRQEFAKARVMLTAAIPTINGIPIEFEHCGDEPDDRALADSEWAEDYGLEAAYDFVQTGTEARPRIVCNAMIVEDEYNPRPKTVLSPGHPNHQAWCAGIAAEMLGLKDRNVFEPVTWDSLTAQEKKMCLTSRLILKAKRSPLDGSITKFKARLTAGGHRSVQDYHFQDSSTPGASSTSPRLMSCFAALTRQVIYGWDILQAYTQAELKQGRTIHIHLPPEMQRMVEHEDWQSHDDPFKKLKRPTVVLKLKKNLYGLKSGGVDFFTSLDEHMANDQNLEISYGDTNLYSGEYNSKNHKVFPAPSLLDDESDLPNRHPEHASGDDTSRLELVACWVFVDDGCQCGPRSWRQQFMKRLQKRWRVDDEKPATDILNIVIEQSLMDSNKSKSGSTSSDRKATRNSERATIRISQSSYVRTRIFNSINHDAFNDPDNVLKRRTPMDFKVMDILDWRDPKLKPGESDQLGGIDERYENPIIALGYVSKSRSPDTLSPIESNVSPFTAEYEYEELAINDESPDATKWSFEKMKEVFDYRELIAKILWCARNTRPDLSVASSVLCRHAVNTPHLAYRGLIQTLRYMASTIDLGITYASDGNKTPIFYCDSDFTTGRCRAGAVTMLAGGAVDWSSALSGSVALSTAEAELYAAIIACQRALILRKDMEQLKFIKETDPLDFREDNQATFLMLSRRVTDYSRMRHIENGFLKCLEWTCRKRIEWTHEPTNSMLADFFTKCLPVPCFLRLRKIIMNLGDEG